MRPFPTQLDYQDALLAPSLCFADPELSSSTVIGKTSYGAPLPATGHFTNVYHLRSATGKEYAVRLFLHDDPQRSSHWATLSQHLNTLTDFPTPLVPFIYQEAGFLLRGEWYPLVRMDWVDGIELHTWLDKNLYAQAQIASIAQAWKQIQTDLLRAHFVHGDIQHGNLLWERETGQLRLIDYDGSMVPPLFALPRRERGHPSYQHPLCFTTPQLPGGIHLDRFPLLVIYVTLRVLQVVPEVWYRLDNGENMLFRREDFTTPHSSRAFNILRSALMGYPQERRLVEILQSSCNLPLARVPLLQTLP